MNMQINNFIKKNVVDNLEAYLCPEIRPIINKIPQDIKDDMEEIRLRITKPLMIYSNNKDYFVGTEGQLLLDYKDSYIVTKRNIENTLQFITDYSIYSVEEELKRGYITVQGGHRIGIVGKVLYDGKGIKTIKDFTGLNFRISREKKGVSSIILKYLINSKGGFMNTLIISPPQCGKTTLLRDIIRNLSNGIPNLKFNGAKIGVVDERSEIAACFQGTPQNDLGIRTDILDACPKAEGIMMLIRAMSPEIIATDEIGRAEDSMAIQEALLAGIKLITTVHGKSLEDILSRKVIGELVKEKIFERILVLSNIKGVGTIEKVIDGHTLKDLLNNSIRNKVVG
ncbi:MAG: stage III sporulation protein AA [Clostridiaceae bacterium]|nr:stage III sporulation protein AA [Clostridiaceae bacterium]